MYPFACRKYVRSIPAINNNVTHLIHAKKLPANSPNKHSSMQKVKGILLDSFCLNHILPNSKPSKKEIKYSAQSAPESNARIMPIRKNNVANASGQSNTKSISISRLFLSW